MRRWIFAALVLANIGMLMWGLQYAELNRPTAPAPLPPINEDKMRLLKEGGPRAKAAGPLTLDVVQSVPGPEKLYARVCYRLGPFRDRAQAVEAVRQLGDRSLALTQREETTHVINGYLIYLPSFPSKSDAERKRAELNKLGFQDHALMHEPGFGNAISLGMFAVEENAQARLKSLAQKGVLAQVHATGQARTIYWVELGPAVLTPDLYPRLKASVNGVANASVLERVCPARGA